MKRILLLAALVLAAATWLNLSAGDVNAAAIKNLGGCGDNTLGAIDDRPSAEHSLAFAINFFGTTYSSVWVNNNGNVTFGESLSSFMPFDLTSTSTAIIAPFFGDVDTRGDGSSSVTYGNTSFGGRPAFCVNWIDVGYYSSADDKLNSFQLIIVDRSDAGAGDFDLYFNYDQIQWETGNASDGVVGLGGDSARAGYSNGIDTSLELPGSAVNGAFLDSSPTGLTRNNRGSVENGRYVFLFRGGAAPTGTPPASTPTITSTPVPPTLLGDVNCDDNVSAIDAALVLQRVAGLLAAFTCPEGADVDENGSVNAIDSAIILQFTAGFLDTLGPTAQPTNTPPPATSTAVPSQSCHPSYVNMCLNPAAEDYDCAGGTGNGPLYVEGPVQIVGDDKWGLDGSNLDGVGCEPQ